jgi:DNA-directed RNA polymerase subunit RPC12/RpoP
MQYESNKCWSCGGKYEFLSEEIGRVWNCPHCDSQIVLTSTPWWRKLFTTRRKAKSLLPDLPKGTTIIDSPSYLKLKADMVRRNKAIAWTILWTVLIVGFLCLFILPNEPKVARSKPQPDFSSQRTPAWQPPEANDRVLPNGTILVYMNAAGKGSLTIENGTSEDAVIKLTASSTCYYIFYVSANNSFTLPNILDGYYRVLYQSGSDWDGQRFTRNLSCARFDDALNFKTTETTKYDGVYEQYAVWKLTLQPVKHGTATTTPISIAEFMR